MASRLRIPRRRALERFGTYNNLRSNPYSNFEKVLDSRSGILDPYTQIAQSVMQTSYNIDSLSSFGNTFRARILGVVQGKPARHLYPDLYANQQSTNGVPEHFIFVLRDESDQFAPDPAGIAANAASYAKMIGLQGDAISEKPADEEMERYAIGDIVEVYKPEQNSWNGALVRKVVVRNNFSQDFPGDADGVVVGGAFNTTAGTAFSGSFTEESGYASTDTGTGADGPQVKNGPVPGYDRLVYDNAGKSRPGPLQPALLDILQGVAEGQNVFIEIFSGGQAPGHGTGSGRHNSGYAADIRIFEEVNGVRRRIFVTDAAHAAESDEEIVALRMYDIALAFFNAGITGMGAHPDYQRGDLHVDIASSNPAYAGSSANYWGKGLKPAKCDGTGDDGPDDCVDSACGDPSPGMCMKYRFATEFTPRFVIKAWVDAENTPP